MAKKMGQREGKKSKGRRNGSSGGHPGREEKSMIASSGKGGVGSGGGKGKTFPRRKVTIRPGGVCHILYGKRKRRVTEPWEEKIT